MYLVMPTTKNNINVQNYGLGRTGLPPIGCGALPHLVPSVALRRVGPVPCPGITMELALHPVWTAPLSWP